ncbi:J domain-containing protein [Xanthomonas fragariae]|uniref:DnaJ domain-containing protein n=1 Tax=Xanthomonas fragariae TaxID=48664 RepID=A0A1Y6H5I4_9XANT|nr:J domain-containing protein [Xanthomonas fragariae]AOD15446.1 molecular chaperone DnaJ [Xanthomonas fragariae]AOD18852.1 molecular chaperone DnaJ [Xanthomonas fragariae]ENZ96848.1 DnaJ domain-containing protein [Xanthomonas fragariae LMG 25863]MBL9196529.1 J domain-containing protein [Xanthomonas fragariae]MBL9221579.1 J domain-containing protein [Xanthomonas fragariae]
MPSKVRTPTDAPASQAIQQLRSQPAQTSGAALSPARKRFDRLLRDLERHRAELQAWQVALSRWRERYYSELQPLLDQRRAADIALVEALDRAHATVKLGKADREFLSELLCDIAGPLIESGHEALRPTYDHHSAVGYDQEVSESDALMKQILGQAYGLDADELDGIDSPEELYERVSERLEQERAQQQQRHAQRRKRTEKKAIVENAKPPPLRELYRKLAGNLHPDRTKNEQDHASRTILMQRLNAAYKSGDLLGLLELQAEIGLLDAQGVDAMSAARLQDYNRELDRQRKELQQQILQKAYNFCAEYSLDLPSRPKPARLSRLMAQLKREIEDDLMDTRMGLRELTNPQSLKRWLKLQRVMSSMPDAPWL